jgi:hypothetical protein
MVLLSACKILARTSPIVFRQSWSLNRFQRTLYSSPIIKVRAKNSNYRFRGRGTSKAVLLDRFIKFTPLDPTLITKAPFNLKCVGSFFDADFNIDTVKNITVGQDRDDMKREEKLARRRETRKSLEDEILGVEEQSIDGLKSKEDEEVSSVQIPFPDLSEHYRSVLNNLQNQVRI